MATDKEESKVEDQEVLDRASEDNSDKENEEVVSSFEVELDDDAIAQVEAAVLAANEGKTKSDLEKEIEEAKSAKLNEIKEHSASVLSKMEELSKTDEHKDKTEGELRDVAISEIEKDQEGKDNGEDDDFKLLGEDFFGSANIEEDPLAETDSSIDLESLPEEVRTKVQKADKWEKLEKEDPVYKAFNEAKEANADIDFVGLIQQYGLAQDPSKAEPIVFKEIELKEMQKQNPSITDEEIEDALEEFREKGPLAQTQEVRSIKEYYVSRYAEAKKNFATKVSEMIDTDKESTKKIVIEAESALKAIEGKSYFGVKIEKPHADKVLNAVRTGNGLYRKPDGSVDIKKTVKANLMVEYGMDMFNALEEEAKKKVRQKVDHRRSRPLSGLKFKRTANVSSNSRAKDLAEAAKKLGRG